MYMYTCNIPFLRVLNIEQGIGESVSGDIHAKSYDVSADKHALLWPLEFKGQITRRLSDWCTAIPAISIACKIESVQVQTFTCTTYSRCIILPSFVFIATYVPQMQFSPLDYQDMMCMLQDLKELKTEPVEEDEPFSGP